MSSFQISFFGATDIGRVQTNNEDTFIAQYIWDERHILLAAIDGMGGEDGGEIAAEIAKQSIIKYLTEFQNDTVLNLIKCAVADANNEIIRQKEVQPQYRRMGCVATAGIIDLDEETLSIAHVGDSRLYRYSNGELSKLTHDHSLVGYQEEQGILSEEQAMRHPRRSVIERCLGSDNHLADDKSFIEAGVFPLIKGEAFLFCSDGLCDVLTSAQISDCLKSESSPEEECRNLINRANEAGGKDNITVVLAHVFETATSENLQTSDTFNTGDNDELANGNGYPSDSKDKRNRSKWMVLAIAILIVCIVVGFFIGKNYSQRESNPNAINNPNKAIHTEQSNILKDSVISTVTNDSITINSESDNHE